MLRSFRLANHRSIRAEQELLLLPVYDGDREVQPVTAIYGANASGKSNLLDGLSFMRQAVRDSYARWEPDQGVPRSSFRLDPKARIEPSHFVVDVVLSGVRYTYGFVVDDSVVLEEWLYSYPEKRRRVIFERTEGRIKFGTTVEGGRSKVEVLEELTRPNALFLSVASRSNLAELIPVYDWFVRRLRLHQGYPRSDTAERVARFMARSSGASELLVDLLRFADFGISDIVLKDIEDPNFFRREAEIRDSLAVVASELAAESDPDRAAMLLTHQRSMVALLDREESARRRKRIQFAHSSSGELFDLHDESDGTRAWLETLLVVLSVLDGRVGGVLVMDEIDTSLHPRLTSRLLELFQDSSTNPGLAQLICTTHDTTLLSPTLGDQALRRGQVWFAEKDQSGESTLFPLSDFKPRTGENTERRYLGGSYGAIPRVFAEDLTQAVQRSVSEESVDGPLRRPVLAK